MPLAVITSNIPATQTGTRNQEAQLISRALDIAQNQIGSAGGAAASGTMVDEGLTLGTWTYTATTSE